MDKCSACPLLWLLSFLALRAVRQDLDLADAIEETTKAQMDLSRFSSPDEKLINKLLAQVTITTTILGKPSTNPGGKTPDSDLGDTGRSPENKGNETAPAGVDYARLEMNAIGGIISAVALSMIAACCKAFVDIYKMTGFVTQMYMFLRRMIQKTQAIQPATTETLSSQSIDSELPSLNV